MPMFSSRGIAFGDLNNDGLVDAVVTNLGEKPLVLLNTSKNDNQRIILKLIENSKNKDAIGARVILKTNKGSMIQEIQAGASYLSQNDFRLHFGFGKNEIIETIEIRWSNGKSEKIEGIRPNQLITIRQAKGVENSINFNN